MGFVAPKVVFLIISQISEKLIFFTLRPVTRKRREMLGWAINGEKPGIHRGTVTFPIVGKVFSINSQTFSNKTFLSKRFRY